MPRPYFNRSMVSCRVEVCAVSGMRAGPDCPHKHEYVARGHAPTATCDWHQRQGEVVRLVYPPEAATWLRRRAARR